MNLYRLEVNIISIKRKFKFLKINIVWRKMSYSLYGKYQKVTFCQIFYFIYFFSIFSSLLDYKDMNQFFFLEGDLFCWMTSVEQFHLTGITKKTKKNLNFNQQKYLIYLNFLFIQFLSQIYSGLSFALKIINYLLIKNNTKV